jgi:hypothetical protein
VEFEKCFSAFKMILILLFYCPGVGVHNALIQKNTSTKSFFLLHLPFILLVIEALHVLFQGTPKLMLYVLL